MSKVPAGWASFELSELVEDTKNSFVIGPFGSDLVQSDYRKSGVPVIFVRDIKRGRFNWISNVFLTHDKALQLKAHSIISYDIVITKMGLPAGIAAVYPQDMPSGIITADIIRMRLNKSLIDSFFLVEVLNGQDVSAQVYERTSGQTRPKLTLTDYKKIKVNIPPLPEQTKIAQILSTWDKAIATTEKLIGNSQQQKKALMQSLLTGKKRLPGFEGEWTIGFLGDLCSFKGGFGFKEVFQGKIVGDIPFIKVSDMNLKGNEIFITKANNWLTQEDICTIRVKPFPADSVVFAKVGAALLLNRRRILIRDTIVDNNMMAGIPFEGCDTNYLYQLMLRIDFARFVQDGAVPSINQSDLSRFKIKFPPLPEQQKIAAVLTAADNEIDLLQKKLAFLKQEKAALMQQLLTGKRRVKVEAA